MTTSIVLMAKHLRVATGNAEYSDALLADPGQREAEREAQRDAREAQQNAVRDAREERHRKEQERLAAAIQKSLALRRREIRLLRWTLIAAGAILGLSYTVTSAFLTFTITSAF